MKHKYVFPSPPRPAPAVDEAAAAAAAEAVAAALAAAIKLGGKPRAVALAAGLDARSVQKYLATPASLPICAAVELAKAVGLRLEVLTPDGASLPLAAGVDAWHAQMYLAGRRRPALAAAVGKTRQWICALTANPARSCAKLRDLSRLLSTGGYALRINLTA